MNPLFAGKIENGKLKLDDINDFKKYLLGLEGKKIQVSVRKYKTSRSLKQNAYYWGVIVPIISDWVGEDDRESIHEALKEKFLKVRTNKGLKIVQSSAKLTTTEFEIYLDKVKRWASMECNLVIPDPNEIDLTSSS